VHSLWSKVLTVKTLKTVKRLTGNLDSKFASVIPSGARRWQRIGRGVEGPCISRPHHRPAGPLVRAFFRMSDVTMLLASHRHATPSLSRECPTCRHSDTPLIRKDADEWAFLF